MDNVAPDEIPFVKNIFIVLAFKVVTFTVVLGLLWDLKVAITLYDLGRLKVI